VAVAAELGIADRLAEHSKAAGDLAGEIGASEGSLSRLLRVLVELRVLTPAGDGRFELTEMGQFLRSDTPGSLRPWALMEGSPWMWAAWGELRHSVKTGEPAVDRALGQSLYEYLRERPEEERVFNGGMAAVAEGVTHAAVLDAYDFSGIGSLVDVGGGRGALLSAILSANPNLRGLVFDRPSVVQEARSHLEAAGLGDRCRVVGGDFFDSVPGGGDAYVISMVLNDWDDESVRAILSNCRTAVPGHARLLIVEVLDDPSASVGTLDLVLLVITPGRLRTEAEWAVLLADSGFRLARAIPTRSSQRILEAVPSSTS